MMALDRSPEAVSYKLNQAPWRLRSFFMNWVKNVNLVKQSPNNYFYKIILKLDKR